MLEIWNQVPVVMKMNKRIADIFLFAAAFFNPFGFDAAQLLLIEYFGTLLKANLVLYFLSALCFGFYIFLSGRSPFDIIKKLKNK